MTTALAEEAYTLNSLDSTTMEKFFENMNELRKNNYAPKAFGDKVRMAINTPASLKEMRGAHNLISGHAGDNADRWIPLQENLSKYRAAGFDDLTADQMSAAKSNQSVWSVINGLTHFATHAPNLITSNMQESDSTKMMVQAGNIFGKTRFDHQNDMPNPFGNNVLQNTTQIGSLLN
jgi:hypothetical protein